MENPVDKSGSLIPLTLFSSVKDNDAHTGLHLTWPTLVEELTDFSTQPFAKKTDAPLFTSCEFSPDVRAKANIKDSGMVILDVDGARNAPQATLDHATQVFEENDLAGLIYTTASHSADRHRYRVLVPIDTTVVGPIYTRAFHSLDALFGETADLTKRGCESLFYLPGDYAGVDNQLIVFDGLILSGNDWADMCPEVVPEARQSASPTKTSRSSPRKSISRGRGAFEWASLFDCPFVAPAMIDAYRDRQHADSWYHGMYVFMCTVAGRAKLRNYQISSQELADLATRLDQFDGGFYPHRDLEREARNAINYIF